MLGKSFPRVTTAVFIYKICVLKGLRIKLRNIWATFVETLSPRCFKMAQSSHSDGRKLSSSALHVYDNLGTTPSSFLDSIKVIAKCTLLLRNSYLFLFIFTEQIEIDEFISEQSIRLCCKNKSNNFYLTKLNFDTMVVAQSIEWLFPMPEVHSLNPIISKIL